jgi:hypothetical protein
MVLRKWEMNWRHALGELVIVVAGILIALAVNNWNDGRKAAATEQEYLTRIASDLRADTATFNLTLRHIDDKAIGLRLADSVLLIPQAEVKDTLALLDALVSGSSLAWRHPNVRRPTFEDLRSTGNLNLIRDLELRTAIVQYYYSTDDAFERIQARRTRYGEITYELVPRKAEFDLADGLVARRGKILIPQIFASGLSRAVTAELNRAGFMRETTIALRKQAVDLLGTLQPKSRP